MSRLNLRKTLINVVPESPQILILNLSSPKPHISTTRRASGEIERCRKSRTHLTANSEHIFGFDINVN